MKKTLVALCHIGFWVCYLTLGMVILAVLYAREGEADETVIATGFYVIVFFALVPALITFYSFYFLIFPKFLLKNKFWQAGLLSVLISVSAASAGFIILNIKFGPNCGIEGEEEAGIGFIVFMSFVAMIAGVIALIIRGFITWFEEIKLKENLKQKTQAMELALVKAQLDPHFLFNTINNIDVLILRDPEIASNYLNKLSDIMRFMLYETKADVIPLVKEIEYIDKYIALQRIRTSNANYAHFSIDGDPSGKSIAPMVFIPFIENAFKHTNNKKIDNAINIELSISVDQIKFICENKYDPTRRQNGSSNGLGNDLIKKRLHLIYPDMHQLQVKKFDSSHSVQLSIDYVEV